MRRRRTPAPPPPLPQRDGVDPVRVRLPAAGPGTTVREHLISRLSAPPTQLDAMFTAGEIVGADGRPVPPDTPYAPGLTVWFHRDMPEEPPVPFPLHVVYQDDHLVVADKPHFLATTPRGSHVRQTALARLRHTLGLPHLTAAHRLDRLTAGLVLFTVRPEERGAYQTLFRDRRVHKEYEAVAPYDTALDLPRTVRSRIVKERGVLTAREADGEPNAETRVELLAHREDGLARYRLVPGTGQTHQLRVHMSALGVPILGDPLYPEVTAPVPAGDFRRPLQLLARGLAFTDPLTCTERRFTSGRALEAWDSYGTWAADQ
ncbi:RluA family pseudouridine synthase [Streptomyces griseoincarnatus]|uniref:RNA pseudouridylate synthase n=1 Tax=Streptomyces griseoincarnatus TaxID=29305 RepID=A0ABT0VXV9_STRGI|nr:RluA family pseudouridine synthase [Streptomyces griseoincarnatus]MCM2516180.1 RluA family pseudouridine synthase [Streptomyces griseoincarnatus]